MQVPPWTAKRIGNSEWAIVCAPDSEGASPLEIVAHYMNAVDAEIFNQCMERLRKYEGQS
jgi:hypothetical protein